MRTIEIENWANRVLENIEKGASTEDHRVEFKSTWAPASQAARIIAGHANSAPDDYILWLMGFDEKARKIVGVQPEDWAMWWPQVEAEFADRIAPEPAPVNMMRDGVPIVAIAFKTDRAPYLVRNEEFGKLRGQTMAWEVPFRVGTMTRTATRSQLLRLLSPMIHLPRVELISAGVALHEPVKEERWVQKCIVDAQFYLIVGTGETVTFDSRSCLATIETEGILPANIEQLLITPLGTHPMPPTTYTCTITGTTPVHLKAEGTMPSIGSHTEQLRLTIKLRPVGIERSVSFTYALDRGPTNPVSGVKDSFLAQNLLTN